MNITFIIYYKIKKNKHDIKSHIKTLTKTFMQL